MRNLYKKVERMIREIDFDSIWKGFSKYDFALYNNETVYLKTEAIPYDNRFLGNTCIEYDEQYIAIWKVTNPEEEDPQLLAADMVHEMFHAFQKTKNESRFPNDLIMLNYDDDFENHKLRHIEHLLLVKAYESDNASDLKMYLAKYIAARKHRQLVLSNIIYQEFNTETIEGMAEYVGSQALKQISLDKYHQRMNHYIANLSCLNDQFFDIRRMLYFSGVISITLFAKSGINLYHEIGSTDTSVYSIAANQILPDEDFSLEIDCNKLRLMTNQHIQQKKEQFDTFLCSHTDKTEEAFTICGYDPMNMIKTDQMILCSHFVMLCNEKLSKPLFLEGPVLLHMKNGSYNEVISYTK